MSCPRRWKPLRGGEGTPFLALAWPSPSFLKKASSSAFGREGMGWGGVEREKASGGAGEGARHGGENETPWCGSLETKKER